MLAGTLTFILIGIVGALGVWLIIYIIRKFFKVILAIILGFLIFIGIGFFFASTRNLTTENKNTTDYIDSTGYQNNDYNDEIETDDSKSYLRNSLIWSDYSNDKHSVNFKIAESDYEQAKTNRSNYSGYTWGDIYNNLYQNDKNLISNIYKKYDSLKTDNDPLDFARLIVSSIQEVPYTWILVEPCEEAPNIAQIEDSGYDCLGDIKNYAVLSPAEFLVTKKGDCDTKSMVLYTILKRFNYDVHILISEQYAHAMLGINIPATGKYIRENGKRYYFWETTVAGMDVGLVPPEYSNLSFWNVAL